MPRWPGQLALSYSLSNSSKTARRHFTEVECTTRGDTSMSLARVRQGLCRPAADLHSMLPSSDLLGGSRLLSAPGGSRDRGSLRLSHSSGAGNTARLFLSAAAATRCRDVDPRHASLRLLVGKVLGREKIARVYYASPGQRRRRNTPLQLPPLPP